MPRKIVGGDDSLVASSRSDGRMGLIAEKALRLFLDRGYQGTSVRDIAAACGIDVKTLYYHIGAKENILVHIVNRELEYNEQFFSSPRHNANPLALLNGAVEAWFRHCDENQDAIMVIYREIRHLPKAVRDRLLVNAMRGRAVFEVLLADAVRTGQADIDDPTLLAFNILALGHMWALIRWDLPKRYTLEQYTKRQTEWIEKIIGSAQVTHPVHRPTAQRQTKP
ncbi:MAG: TetR/AcrR family transcriptional regulator [Dehalococcoidia bacterium]|nr:TetR/AcrR family transcriptional regulator [Dehalococcoidia bacterium]